MTAAHPPNPRAGGILLQSPTAAALQANTHKFLEQLEQLELRHFVEMTKETASPLGDAEIRFQLHAELAQSWAPGFDTLGLAAQLQSGTEGRTAGLEQEIVLAMLAGPLAFVFPSHAELAASVRMRRNTVLAARKTALAFYTAEADRPEDCWVYDEERGFTVRPGQPLIHALQKAT
ncbi:MAG: hypothetical protein JWR60_987, partial [Polaromonas sp.]|nr:hypothetical protein [Polaromonas sp.]